jgi:hypothetical protein
MTFDQYTGLYFYSAIFQGNMALIAFAGVFAVFRIQLLAQSIQLKESEITKFLSAHYTSNSYPLPEELRSHFNNVLNIMTHINALLSDPNYRPSSRGRLEHLPNNQTLQSMLRELGQLTALKQTIISNLRFPFASIVAIILISVTLIPFASQIHSCGGVTEALFFGAVLLAQTISIVMNGKFVFTILRS